MLLQKRVLSFIGFLAVLALAILLKSETIIQTLTNSVSQIISHSGTPEVGEWGYLVIGIEFGDTYSRVGYRHQGKHKLALDDQGRDTVPSYVSFTDQGPLVGFEAKDQAKDNPQNTIINIRRLIGRNFSDPTFQKDIKDLPYEIVEHDDQPVVKVKIDGSDQMFTPVEISAKIFGKLKDMAEYSLGRRVEETLITVPSYFNDQQRQAVKDAASLVGLHTLRVMNEPTSASIGYGLDLMDCRSDQGYNECFVLIYNLEDSNVDVTLLGIDRGVFEILSSGSDRSVGRIPLENALLNHATTRYKEKSQLDLSNNPELVEKLEASVKNAERTLLAEESATIEIGDFSETITQDQLQNIYRAVFDTSSTLIDEALTKSKIDKGRVDHILITGNTEISAKIQPFLEAYFDGKKVLEKSRSDEAVILGATAQSQILTNDDGIDCCSWIDVSILDIGIETNRGLFRSVIPRNSVIPTRKRVVVSTIKDNQDKILIPIVEGQRPLANKNQPIGIFEIVGIPPAPKGVPQIEVGFELSVDGALRIDAEVKESGKEHKLVILNHMHAKQFEERQEGVDHIFIDAEKYYEDDLAAVDAIMQGGGKDDEFGCSALPSKNSNYDL